jgi:soluble lytic murein transglycosylase-like protein
MFALGAVPSLDARRANGAAAEALILPPSISSLPPVPPRLTLRGPRQFHPFIEQAAAAHSVSPTLIEAVIRVESSYNPRAVSRKGARGLMQLMPDTAARFGVRDAFDPRQNVLGGAKYLSVLLAQFEGDVALACAAYNAGEQTVLRYGGIPPYRETRQYVEKIRRILEGRGVTVAMASAPAPPPPQPVYVYSWRDARGVLNFSQYPPPAGQRYERRRMR